MKNQSKSKSSNRKLGVVVLGLIKQKGIVKLPLRVEEYKSEKICHKSEDFLDFGNLMRDFLSVYPYEESDKKKQIIEIEISEEDYNRLKKDLSEKGSGKWKRALNKWEPQKNGTKTVYLYSYSRPRIYVLLGEYDRTFPKIILYMNTIKKYCKEEDKEKLIHTIHIHELFHAYFHFVTEQIHRKQYNYIPEIEEAMAEFSTLVCLKEMSDNNIHPDSVEILNFAQKEIEEKQNEVGFLAAYGFGAYLYENLEEKLRFNLINKYIEKLGDIDVNDEKVKEFRQNVWLSKFVPGNQKACLELLREILESPESRQEKTNVTIMTNTFDLRNLDTNELSRIINGFSSKIFQSEAQFQFDLAWKLKSYNWDVKLEDMRMKVVNKRDNKVVQKFYTDIVLEQGNYSVAIELKYKTAKYDANGIELFEHGAVDMGRYDYLWDVFRIELLTNKNKQNIIPNINDKNVQLEVLKGCNKGFAVLLTNEKKYWDRPYRKNLETIDHQFRIGENKNQLYGINLDWEKKNGDYTATVKGTFRAQPIHLNQAYSYEWVKYRDTHGEKNGEFRFVIIEIK